MFSTSFWNWMPLDENQGNNNIVSDWIWIYFLCSFLLSLVVYLVTYCMHRRKQERRDRRRGATRKASSIPNSNLAANWSHRSGDGLV